MTADHAAVYYPRLEAEENEEWGTAKRLTWTTGNSYDPAIAIDSNGHIHVIWYEETPGNYEIYCMNSK